MNQYDDLVKRLRGLAMVADEPGLEDEAADAIETLVSALAAGRAILSQAEEALIDCSDSCGGIEAMIDPENMQDAAIVAIRNYLRSATAPEGDGTPR